jgi:ElaB/YqjD/DUF883 family membrane-anchored ribosome-binding protein
MTTQQIPSSPEIEQALASTQSAANQALDGVQQAVDSGVQRLRESTQYLRASAQRAGDGTLSYIRQEPVKSVLLAAATGAALVALVSLLTRRR